MLTLLIFLFVLSVLVISHEWGHFFTARWLGITVHEFGFGFPPRLFGMQVFVRIDSQGKKERRYRLVRGPENKAIPAGFVPDTLYSFNLIPLGGFVKIKGEGPEEAGSMEADSFLVKKSWQKALVLVAGVGMNVLTAFLLLTIGFMAGVPELTDSLPPGASVQNRQVEILQVLPGKPAATAGLQPGDAVLKIGELERPRVAELQAYVDSHRQQSIPLVIERDDQTQTFAVQPMVEEGKGLIGIAIAEVGIVRYPWYSAVYHGAVSTGIYLKEIFAGFYELFKGLAQGKGAGQSVSGPVGVAVMTGQVARMGFSYLLQFMALLSLNLAVLNILPIPALDGGRLLFVILNKVFGRPVSARYEQIVHSVGFVLLMLLVVLITARDLGQFRVPFADFIQRIF